MSLFDWWWLRIWGLAPSPQSAPPAVLPTHSLVIPMPDSGPAMHGSMQDSGPPPAPEPPAAPAPPAPAAAPQVPVLSVADIARLVTRHRHFPHRVSWAVGPGGVLVDGAKQYERTPGEPATVRRILDWWGLEIRAAAMEFRVPAELIIATIATEAAGGARDRAAAEGATRHEPGYLSDARTPHRVSYGVMQTLLSTARYALDDGSLTAAALLRPATSIRAGTAYIASQRRVTGYDPPLVAAAYNAGGLYESAGNRWGLRSTGAHIDRFVRWYGDASGVLLIKTHHAPREVSAARLLAGRA